MDTGRWLAGRQVLLAPAAVEDVPGPDEALQVHVTRETVEASPDYEPVEYLGREA